MKVLTIGLFLSVITEMTLHAQDTIPHVRGNITLSVKQGTIACDLTVSNMPRLKDYYFRLNAGMNIHFIKNAEPGMSPLYYDRSFQDTLSSGETLAYYIPSNIESEKYLPQAIRFRYTGMYPVITDSSSVVDWRGNLAFNGTTLRADGIQSAWCPILYDIKTDTRYEKVTYDLDITCNDCKVIYMNGSEPVTGTHAKLTSRNAQDLTLFAGDYKVVPIHNDYFLNPDASEDQLKELDSTLNDYQQYFAKKLGIPFKGKTVYIQTTPVSKHYSWLFASYPTIVKVDWEEGMKAFASKDEGSGFLQYMSHELAHYYFGNVRSFNAEIGGMISEGFAEYLALQITRNRISDSLYQEKMKAKVRAMSNRNFKPVPIASVHSKNDYKNREFYVYYYAPILFSAIEKEIGEAKMSAWMKALLLTPTVLTNYPFFEQTFSKVLHDKQQFEQLRDKYFVSENAYQNALLTLNLQSENVSLTTEEKPVAKTYYYFFFSAPSNDAGSSQNQVITHTEIGKITCTHAELSAMAMPVFEKIRDQCENASGCSSDFNTYDSMEMAQSALKRWLKKYNKDGKLQVKILKPY